MNRISFLTEGCHVKLLNIKNVLRVIQFTQLTLKPMLLNMDCSIQLKINLHRTIINISILFRGLYFPL